MTIATATLELGNTCMDILESTEGSARFESVSIVVDGDTRTVCFEGEPILDTLEGMESDDIQDLTWQVSMMMGTVR